MSDWPIEGSYPYSFNPYTAGYYVSMAVGAGANVKGAWSQVTASLPVDCGFFVITIFSTYYTACYSLIDVGIGGAGSEAEIVSNLFYCNPLTSQYFLGTTYKIPVGIKAGTRVACRMQSSDASNTFIGAGFQFYPVSWFERSLARSATYGPNTANGISSISIDPGASADTKGAWTEVVSSLPWTVRAFCLGQDNYNKTISNGSSWMVDIGVGAAGSEVAIVQDYAYSLWSSLRLVLPTVTELMPITIPAGSRLSMRCKCNINSAGYRLFTPGLYLFG